MKGWNQHTGVLRRVGGHSGKTKATLEHYEGVPYADVIHLLNAMQNHACDGLLGAPKGPMFKRWGQNAATGQKTEA
jgi:hypothetical protein